MNNRETQSQMKDYYDDRYSKGNLFTSRYRRYEQFLKPLQLEAGRRLLDVGCGAGQLLDIVLEKGLFCFGIDLSGEAVKIARNRHNNTKFQVIIGNGEELPYDSDFFDYVTAIGTLEHFLHPDKGAREIARVCRNTGRICIVVPNSFGPLHKLGIYSGTEQIREKLASLSEWKKFLGENGLEVIQIGRDTGPDIFRDFKLYKIIQRLLIRFTAVMPLCMAYQFVFICKKKGETEVCMGK